MENKFESLFNENMTSTEAENIFFSSLESATTEDRKRLIEVFAPALSAISARETKEKVWHEDDNLDRDTIDKYRKLSKSELDYIIDVLEKNVKAKMNK